jgi:transcriptional regulator with XRE-family HTH domain
MTATGAARPRQRAARPAQVPTRPVDLVGRRISRERAVRGLSIEDLAERAGVSTGLLSQIERGIGNPSLSTLLGLAGALSVPLGSFFEGMGADSDIVVRPATRKRLEVSDRHLVYELLVPDLQGSLSMLRIELPPGFSNSDKPFSHIGEEAELVLEGQLEAHIGDREFLLSPGDSIRFNCAIPHWFRTFDERAIVISAMTPPSF